MNAAWSVRDATQDDLPRLYNLALATYGNDPNSVPATFSYEHMVWQLLQSPFGPFRARVAHAGEEIVGFYGVIPTQLYVQGGRIAGSLSLLTMTHPAYHRQGIFVTLASQLYSRLGEEGIAITHGFPNENSLPGLLSRLQWAHIATLDVHVRPLNPRAIARRVIRFRPLSAVAGAFRLPLTWRVSADKDLGFRLREVESFDTRVDALMETRKDHYTIQQVRDSAYLNWRYTRCPDWNYRIVIAEDRDDLLGYIVTRCVRQYGLSGGMIMDIAARPGRHDVWPALIREAVAYSRSCEMDLVASMAHGDADVLRALRRCWFVKTPSRLGFKKWYFGARLNNAQLSPEIVNDPKHWLLTFGDDDVL